MAICQIDSTFSFIAMLSNLQPLMTNMYVSVDGMVVESFC